MHEEVVEGLASYVLDTALDPTLNGVAHRAGAVRTRAVQTRTTLLLLRLHFHILTQRDGRETADLTYLTRTLTACVSRTPWP